MMCSSAVDLGEPGPDGVLGHGRIDALAAAAVAAATPDVTSPTVPGFSPESPAGWDGAFLRVDFSEPLDDDAISNPALYVLVEAGDDGAFDTSDDVSCELSALVDSWSRQVTITSICSSPCSQRIAYLRKGKFCSWANCSCYQRC